MTDRFILFSANIDKAKAFLELLGFRKISYTTFDQSHQGYRYGNTYVNVVDSDRTPDQMTKFREKNTDFVYKLVIPFKDEYVLAYHFIHLLGLKFGRSEHGEYTHTDIFPGGAWGFSVQSFSFFDIDGNPWQIVYSRERANGKSYKREGYPIETEREASLRMTRRVHNIFLYIFGLGTIFPILSLITGVTIPKDWLFWLCSYIIFVIIKTISEKRSLLHLQK